ncbi:MAG: hypothetical protein J6T01_02410 [Kiritimatiellae bacterium]|nr:hypothetical protein [Kiritimatiellia bacterium]
MPDNRKWYVRTEDGKVYGPATAASLVAWAKDGRVEPTSFLSTDRKSWMPAQLMPELEMKWLVETEPGKVFGPFNRSVVSRLSKEGGLGADAKIYRLHEFHIDEDPPPVVKEVRVEVPVEKIVEKEVRVEVPVEKIVEKEVVKEVRVEVPVEKIVEKIVEVPPPPRTEIVVAEVVEPVGAVPPPPRPAGSIFGNVDRSSLSALENAARRELAAVKNRRVPFGMFGGKKK